VPLAAWCALALALWPAPPYRVWVDAAWLAAAVAGGAAIFWTASLLLSAPERADLLRMLPGRGRTDTGS